MKDKKNDKNKKVNWKNLIDDRCPVCGYEIASFSTAVLCENPKCAFFLTWQCYDKIRHAQEKLLEIENLKKYFPSKTGHHQMTIYDKIN